MWGLPNKSHSKVGIGIREEACIGVVTTAEGNNKEDSGRTGKYYTEGGLDYDTNIIRTIPPLVGERFGLHII